MRAWAHIIEMIRNEDVNGATESYRIATGLPLKEAREVIVKQVDKVRVRKTKRKAKKDEAISTEAKPE